MQVDNVAAAGMLVQSVYILRDKLSYATLLFQLSQRMVCGIRGGIFYRRPARHRASPVAAASQFIAHEILVLDGRFVEPFPFLVAIGRQARLHTDTRSGEYEQAGISLQELR
jgi:hypothetical protein